MTHSVCYHVWYWQVTGRLPSNDFSVLIFKYGLMNSILCRSYFICVVVDPLGDFSKCAKTIFQVSLQFFVKYTKKMLWAICQFPSLIMPNTVIYHVNNIVN